MEVAAVHRDDARVHWGTGPHRAGSLKDTHRQGRQTHRTLTAAVSDCMKDTVHHLCPRAAAQEMAGTSGNAMDDGMDRQCGPGVWTQGLIWACSCCLSVMLEKSTRG